MTFRQKLSQNKLFIQITFVLFLVLVAGGSAVLAHPDDGGGNDLHLDDPSAALAAQDAATDGMVVSEGPFAKVNKNLTVAGRGERLSPNATTDVWSLGRYAYTGTFNNPCGGNPDAGVWIWDVHNANKVSQVGFIASPTGSRSNDVKVAAMNSGDILIHSNESCGGGPGGFEIYNVDDPLNPVHMAHVGPIDELNPITPLLFGEITDVGVHNLWLFTDGDKDYAAAVTGSAFDTFRIYDISDPSSPTRVAAWGAEEVFDPGVGDETSDFGRVLDAAIWLTTGFGASQNRFLHDVTITEDGNQAYLSNWDAGLILLDISDPTNPQYVSTALDVVNGSLDGEVNSHAAWPNENGSIVVEVEEDFAAFDIQFTIDTGPNAGAYPSSEAGFTTPIITLQDAQFSGPTTYAGPACNSSPSVPPAASSDAVALIQRGACRFDEKATNAINAGYSAMVVFNDAARGDALVSMGGDPRAIAGVFVGHSAGLAVMDVGDAGSLVIGASGAPVTAASVPGSWGGVRIWDYSDPTNPILASTYNTVCSADAGDPICDLGETYSVHNVQVETTGNKVKAYFSGYANGTIILDVSDAYNPVETARYEDESPEFVAQNGGNQDVWGLYKVENSPWIYTSDRNGGLYVLKEYGSGSAGNGQ